MGRALGRRLYETGWKIVVVTSTTQANARRATHFIGGGRPAAGIPATLIGASTILLTVPDDCIAPVAADLARQHGPELLGKIVLHTSGARDSSALEPLRACGAATGSMHPLQTFNAVNVPPLVGRVFGIEGDELAVRMARRMARSLGGVPVGIAAENKSLYHAAGAFAAGLSLALEEAGVQVLMSAGLKRREAQSALLSLTRQVLEHYEKLGPQKAWTGPLARGDFGVVAEHAEALRRAQPEFLETYRAVSRLSALVLAGDPEVLLQKLDTIFAKEKPLANAKGGRE